MQHQPISGTHLKAWVLRSASFSLLIIKVSSYKDTAGYNHSFNPPVPNRSFELKVGSPKLTMQVLFQNCTSSSFHNLYKVVLVGWCYFSSLDGLYYNNCPSFKKSSSIFTSSSSMHRWHWPDHVCYWLKIVHVPDKMQCLLRNLSAWKKHLAH